MKRLKVIVFTRNIPQKDQSSGERRFFSLLELLAKSHNVSLCVASYGHCMTEKNRSHYVKELEKIDVNVLPLNKDVVDVALKSYKHDIGFFEFYWIALEILPKFHKYQPQAKVIVDSVDVHFAREEMQASIGLIEKSKAKKTKKQELAVYRSADATIAVSDDDYQILSVKENVKPVFVIPNIVPTNPRKDNRRKPHIIFIGGYLWPPNVDAVIWFVDKIWPAVYNQNKDAKFFIIGSNPTEELKKLDEVTGIEVVGYVQNTASYYNKTSVAVAPLRYGGGMKGKINEAMSYGVPVVSTSIGAQGFNAQNGKHMLIADKPEDFAGAIIDLLSNPDYQLKIGLAGQKLNESICNPAKIEIQLEKMLNYLMNTERPQYRENFIKKIKLFLVNNLNKLLRGII